MSGAESLSLLTTPELVTSYLTNNSLEKAIGPNLIVSEQLGGFANFVYRLDTDKGQFYLKQRPTYIKTRPEIPRNPQDVADEIHAYELLSGVMPKGSVPQLVHVDRKECLFITSAAKNEGTVLSEAIASGKYEVHSGELVGELLASLHGKTLGSELIIRDNEREKQFYDRQYQWLVRDLPYKNESVRQQTLAKTLQIAASPKALIWGDLSPKNIVLSNDSVAFVDLETVHKGDPAFDLGYILGHILLEGLKSGDTNGAHEFARSIQNKYQDTLRHYADTKLIAQVTADAILFAGTTMIHRTLAALVPEATSQKPDVTEHILEYAHQLIQDGVVWQN
jgi:5-methylthioribose kinase